MSKKKHLVAMVPARIGSTRLKRKNLALLNGKPLVSYAISAALEASVFDSVYLNSDDKIFKDIASEYGAKFHHRDAPLGSSTTKSDDVVAEFINKHNPEILAWVNPISPLQTSDEIRKVIEFFNVKNLDSLITVERKNVHANFGSQPLNYLNDEGFAQTQDIAPVELFVYSMMVWRCDVFMDHYKRNGHAMLSGKTGFFPVSKLSSIIVKTEEDLNILDGILKSREKKNGFKLSYAAVTNSDG